MRRAKSIFIGVVLGTILSSASVALAAQTWSWYTDATGEASGSLGSLVSLQVSDARGGDGLLPGETMAIRVDVGNPNRVALTIVSAEIGDLKSGDGTCDASLEDSRLRFDRTPDLVVQPGANDGIVLGNVKLPKLLAQDCQGRDISAAVSLRAAFGATT